MEIGVIILKKWVILILCFVVSVVLFLGFLHYKNERESDIVTLSIDVANTVIKMKRGIDTSKELKSKSGDLVTQKVFDKIKEYQNSLKALNDVKFNVTEYYNKHFALEEDDVQGEDVGAGASADDEQYVDETDTVSEKEDVVENDSRIITEDGVDYIPVKLLDFADEGKDVIAYKGIYMTVERSDVPETYDEMIKNPKNYYIYKTHKILSENDKNYIDVLFESVKSGNTVIIRVFNDGSKITDFEVRE